MRIDISNCRPWLCGPVLALALSCSAMASEAAPRVGARVGDPFEQCESVARALPRTLAQLRAKGQAISEKVDGDTAEYCDPAKYRCKRVELRAQGLYVDMIDAGSKHGLSPLRVELTSNQWQLMKGLRVGQPVAEAVSLYGAEMPENTGQFAICGEVVCLEVEHRNQRVTQLRLDCQSSI